MINSLKISIFLTIRFIKRSNKWTLGLIIFLIAIAFVNLVFITSLFNGIIEMSNNQIINTTLGHITVYPVVGQDYFSEKDQLAEKIRQNKEVEGLSFQMMVPASLKYKNVKGNWVISAIDPTDEKTVTNVSQKMISGVYLEENDKYQMIIGSDVAGDQASNIVTNTMRGAKVGDKAMLLFNGKEYEFTIKGIYKTKFMFADRFVFINQKTWNEILPSSLNKASSLNIRLKDKKSVDGAIDGLKNNGVAGEFYKWNENMSFMETINKTFAVLGAVLTSIGALIAAITIFIVIYIDVSNRRQQIGILRAIGINPNIIRISYILQALVYSLLGIMIGILAFMFILVPYFNVHPLPLPLGDATLIMGNKEMFLRSGIVVLVALISGFIPSYFITKTKIINAISGK